MAENSWRSLVDLARDPRTRVSQGAVAAIRRVVRASPDEAEDLLLSVERRDSGLSPKQIAQILHDLGPSNRIVTILSELAEEVSGAPDELAAIVDATKGWPPGTGALDLALRVLGGAVAEGQQAALQAVEAHWDDGRVVEELDRLISDPRTSDRVLERALSLRYSDEGIQAAGERPAAGSNSNTGLVPSEVDVSVVGRTSSKAIQLASLDVVIAAAYRIVDVNADADETAWASMLIAGLERLRTVIELGDVPTPDETTLREQLWETAMRITRTVDSGREIVALARQVIAWLT